jgi:hypothetical protein
MSTQVKVAVIGAIALVAAALVTGFLTRPGSDRPDPPPPPGHPDPVSVTIYDRLGDTQYSESLNIKIDGKSEGDLIIQDRQRPEASLSVSLAPGTHTFEIEGSTYALAQDGSLNQYPVIGEGTIDIIKGDSDQSFEVTGTITPDGVVADLGRV